MYFTNQSENSFTAKFPITKDAFAAEFSQVLIDGDVHSNSEDKFFGKLNFNEIQCNRLYNHKSGSRIIVEVIAKLVQEDSHLIIGTTLNARKIKSIELRGYSSFMGVVIMSLIAIMTTLFVVSAITNRDIRFLLIFFPMLFGYFLGKIQLGVAKNTALDSVIEELKKEYELAYLKAMNNQLT